MAALPKGINPAYLYYGYTPNQPIIFVSIAVFSVIFIVLCIRTYQARSPKVFFFLPYTALMEIVGFGLRYVCTKNIDMAKFTASSILILICANLIALLNYKCLGDVIRFSKAERKFWVIGPSLAGNFFKLTILASIFQAVGGILVATKTSINAAKNLSLAGIVIQTAVLAVFLLCTLYVRLHDEYEYTRDGHHPKNKIVTVLLATTTLIFARIIYRLQNTVGIRLGHVYGEWSFYVFDILLIVLCYIIYCIFYTGSYFSTVAEKIEKDEENLTSVKNESDTVN